MPAFSINDQNIFCVYFDKQSEIITDVWIFDSMINEIPIVSQKAISMVPNYEIIISIFEEALKR